MVVSKESLALVLEDTELGRWALRRALETAGFEVLAVSTWPEACACLVGARVSLALVAVSSILGNVADIVTGMCRDYPNIHLILLADRDAIDELRPVCAAAADILAKPFDLEQIAHVALSRAGRA